MKTLGIGLGIIKNLFPSFPSLNIHNTMLMARMVSFVNSDKK